MDTHSTIEKSELFSVVLKIGPTAYTLENTCSWRTAQKMLVNLILMMRFLNVSR